MTTINVTSDIIKNNPFRNCFSCPVAMAIKPHLKNNILVSVTHFKIRFYGADKALKHINEPFHEIYTPYNVSGKVRTFDNFEQMIPFSFNLDIPKELLR